jgi:alkanesulfonate monooxygenase SsuD/methylene tetrahydromethanopterin reductase-like flavin-dependent oxidoreductase (luciferase family)
MTSDLEAAIHMFRSGYQPSPRWPEPHLMVSASVIAAETTEEAQFLAGPSKIMGLSLRTGRLGPIVSPETAATMELSDLERSVIDQLPGTQYVGTGEEVAAGLSELADRTGAAELIIAGTAYDPATRVDTLQRVAKAWF